MLNVVIRSFVCNFVNKLFRTKFVEKNTNKIIILFVVTLFVLFCFKSVHAQEYQYKGVYSVQSVLTNYCEDCYLQLPIEYLQSNIILSVNSDKITTLFKAIQSASRAAGWELKKHGNSLVAEPVQNDGNLVFISCATLEPVNVPKYLYSYAKRSDSLKCVRADSLARLERLRVDSLQRINDSLGGVFLSFSAFQLKYYAYSKGFTDKMGVDWSEMLASGNLHDKLRIYDSWALYAVKTNDTAYTFRQVDMALDSSISIDWGTEEQTLLNTFVNDGVTSNNYEWRKYGLIVNIKKDNRRVFMDYTFRDKENSVTLLSGSVAGELGDTLKVSGQYISDRIVEKGIPFLSAIPLLGILFETKQNFSDLRNFELYLIPKNGGKNEKNN